MRLAFPFHQGGVGAERHTPPPCRNRHADPVPTRSRLAHSAARSSFTFRSEFEQIARPSGIEGLTRRLAEKNQPAALK